MRPLLAAVPVDVTGEAAREAARRELAKPIYHQDDSTLFERGVRWLLDRFSDLLDRAVEASPGGYAGLLGLLVLAVLVVVAIRLKTGPLARAAAGERSLFTGRPLTADDHRRAADRHAAAGEWALAVRERLRAVVRDLEQRGVLEARPGRTADEAAAEAGASLPGCAAGLRAGARLFDEIWYGGRPADAAADASLRDLDAAVRAERAMAGAIR